MFTIPQVNKDKDKGKSKDKGKDRDKEKDKTRQTQTLGFFYPVDEAYVHDPTGELSLWGKTGLVKNTFDLRPHPKNLTILTCQIAQK